MNESQPNSPKKSRTWIWVVVTAVVVLGLGCLLVAGAGAFAVWKGYIRIPGMNMPALKSPVFQTPKLPSLQTPKNLPTTITVEPYQPQRNDQYPTLQNLAPNWQDPTAPITNTYTINIQASQPVLLTSGWCTTTKTVLDQNFQHINYLVEVDGKPVDISKLYQESSTALGQTCKDFVGIIRAWPTGNHTIQITMRVDAKINDGWNDYTAGDYTEVYNVTVTP